MSPAQLLSLVKKATPPPAVLLLGPEAYQRRRIKEAMLAAFPEGAVTQHDLSEMALAETLDDARALSLFASERLIWVVNAEAALPRGKAAEEDADAGDDAPSRSAGDAAPLAAYMADPTPGVTLVFEAIRFDFEGDDKRKQERVRKFYAPIQAVVELHRYTPGDARNEAEALVRNAGFRVDPAALDLLVESLGADIARIAVEIEKLALFAGSRPVTMDDITALVPDARAATVFALVNALGRRDRARSLGIH
jgi:DNA polymerase-3 subunit delta